jgi:hypothetical protein
MESLQRKLQAFSLALSKLSFTLSFETQFKTMLPTKFGKIGKIGCCQLAKPAFRCPCAVHALA